MKRARIGAAWLLLLGVGWTACREVSVCSGEAECGPPTARAGEGGVSVPDPVANGGAPGGTGEVSESNGGANGGAGAEAGGMSGAAGEATGGAPPVGPDCDTGHADCDESALTVCETPINFSFRHCGACDARCGGVCSVGKCKPPENLIDKSVERTAANASAIFALIYAPPDHENLHRFDSKTGADAVLVEGLDENAELRLGADRLYAFYEFDHRVLSWGLDGNGAKTEEFSAATFGVTNAGVYYTSYVADPKTQLDSWTLWFKAEGASAFAELATGTTLDILGSSVQGLIVLRDTGTTSEILLARGADLSPLGESPGGWEAAAAAAGGAVFLLSNEAAPGGYELLWLRPDRPPAHILLEAPPADTRLVPAPDGIALQLDDHNNTFVRIFSPEGPEAVPLGIPYASTLVLVDERYLWYSWLGAADATMHFQRARQFEYNDLLP